jgi:hypothetical protein
MSTSAPLLFRRSLHGRAGLVLSSTGGNVTGFMTVEYSMAGKWLELLKQIAPDVTRVAVLRDPATPTGVGQFGVIQAMAQPLRVETASINVRDADEIERGAAAFSRAPNGGLILTPSGLRFCAAAARTRLDRGPHRRDRGSLGGGAIRAFCGDRRRVCPAQGRCHCHVGTRGLRSEARDLGHPNRVRDGGRPS